MIRQNTPFSRKRLRRRTSQIRATKAVKPLVWRGLQTNCVPPLEIRTAVRRQTFATRTFFNKATRSNQIGDFGMDRRFLRSDSKITESVKQACTGCGRSQISSSATVTQPNQLRHYVQHDVQHRVCSGQIWCDLAPCYQISQLSSGSCQVPSITAFNGPSIDAGCPIHCRTPSFPTINAVGIALIPAARM